MKQLATICFAIWQKLAYAAKKGYMNLFAHTVTGTDVVMVPIVTLINIKPDGLCVEFDSGALSVVIHKISAVIDSRKSATLPMYPALTACVRISICKYKK